MHGWLLFHFYFIFHHAFSLSAVPKVILRNWWARDVFPRPNFPRIGASSTVPPGGMPKGSSASVCARKMRLYIWLNFSSLASARMPPIYVPLENPARFLSACRWGKKSLRRHAALSDASRWGDANDAVRDRSTGHLLYIIARQIPLQTHAWTGPIFCTRLNWIIAHFTHHSTNIRRKEWRKKFKG